MTEKQRKSWIYLEISICFMIFIFAPLEIYFTNIDEFWFSLMHLLPILAVGFIIGNILLYLLYIFTRKSKRFYIIYSIFLGMFLGFYIQGNYLPRNYGVLDGREIQWDKYTGYKIASVVLWGMVLILIICSCMKLREKIYQIGLYLCISILLIQIITTGVLGIQNPKIEKDIVITEKDMFCLSENKNIVVLLLDAFDSSVLMNMLNGEDAENIRQILKDFTYYPDAVGAYPTTKGSLPFILTGKWYENEVPYEEYIKNAYEETEIYQVLQKNDFSIDLYASSLYISSEVDLFDNIIEGKYVVGDYLKFSKLLYTLVAFNYVPHQMKNKFLIYSDEFSNLKSRKAGEEKAFSVAETPRFYNALISSGIRTTKDHNAFRFYHLAGNHPPYTFGAELVEDDSGNFDVYDEAKGCLNLLNEYMEQLKNCGIYDNTAVIVLADHGHTGNDWQSAMAANPLFLVKDFGEKHEFAISETAVSWEDLNILIQSLAAGDNASEVLHELERAERRFLYYTWDGDWDKKYLPRLAEYKIVGKAYDNASIVPTGKIYMSVLEEIQGFDFKEDIQIPIDENNEDYQKLVFSGFGEIEMTKSGTPVVWACNQYSYFTLNFSPDYKKDFRFTLDVAAVVGNSSQRVIVYANGMKVDCVSVTQGKIIIDVPNSYIMDQALNLIVYYPDAYIPAERGNSKDIRRLSFLISGVKCEEIDIESEKLILEEKNQGYHFKEDIQISIDENNEDYQQLVFSGLSYIEMTKNGNPVVWTSGEFSCFKINFELGYSKDFRLILDIAAKAGDGEQDVIVYANDIEVNSVSVTQNKIIIDIPNHYITDGKLNLDVYYPNAYVPAENGDSKDLRKLAFLIGGITCQECQIE